MSVNRYNLSMTFLDLLAYKRTTVYSLSLFTGIPRTTLTDIASGKADIMECSGKTLLVISKSLNITIEELLSIEREEPKGFWPSFLQDSINEYRKGYRNNSNLIDCYSDQLNSSINVAEIEHLITKEQADRLRRRYFEEDYLAEKALREGLEDIKKGEYKDTNELIEELRKKFNL